ncbi:transcriptional regulator [Bacillus sp. TS-2]|nr:transcriptional regulator [Bacillus sp. TS-2]
MNVLNQLKEKKQFTPNEVSIADFILSQKEQMLYLTIQELAKQTYTSHSAIVRLTQKLGFMGFKEFSIVLAQELNEEKKPQGKVNPNYPFSQNESPIQIANEMSTLMSYTIEKTCAYMENDLLEKCAHLLKNSERIFIYAWGDSQIRAKSFQNKMLKINQYVVIATELSEWSHHTVNLTTKDCAIFLTYHANKKEFIKAAEYLARKKIPIITITASSSGLLSEVSSFTISVPNIEDKFAKIGTFASQISFEYVLNTIYSCVYKLDYDQHKIHTHEGLK